MYLIRLLTNFVVFCVFCEFLWILWNYLNFTTLRPHEISEALNSQCLSNQFLWIFQSIKLLEMIVLFTWPCLHYNQTTFLVILHLTTVSHNYNLLSYIMHICFPETIHVITLLNKASFTLFNRLLLTTGLRLKWNLVRRSRKVRWDLEN